MFDGYVEIDKAKHNATSQNNMSLAGISDWFNAYDSPLLRLWVHSIGGSWSQLPDDIWGIFPDEVKAYAEVITKRTGVELHEEFMHVLSCNCLGQEFYEGLRHSFPKYRELRDYLKMSALDPKDVSKVKSHIETRVGWRTRSTTVGKFFRKLKTYFKFNITNDDIEEACREIATLTDVDAYSVESFPGNPSEVYYEYNFDSCMEGEYATEFYDDQDCVEMVVAYRDGDVVGRALLWTGEFIDKDGNVHEGRYLDRIYPSDGGLHIAAMTRWAQEQGWEYRLQHSVGGSTSFEQKGWHFRVPVYVDGDKFPYLDTMYVSRIINEGSNGHLYSSRKAYRQFNPDGPLPGLYYWQKTNNSVPWWEDSEYYDDEDDDDGLW